MMRRWKWWLFCIAVVVGAGTIWAIVLNDALTCLWRVLLIELVLIALFICFSWVTHDEPSTSWLWTVARTIALVTASAIVLVLSSTRPVDIDVDRLNYQKPSPMADRALLEIEFAKTNEEIRVRIQQEDTWYHIKFVLVGAILAAFGAIFKFGKQTQDAQFAHAIISTATCSLLALACIVALAIDTHLRNNIIVILQLGLWVAHYAEPALMPAAPTSFLPWEQFLRAPGGMHSDNLYGFAFYPHLHFLTWVVYALYLCCFHALALRKNRESASATLLNSGFLAVHIGFVVFAWVGHYVPGAFLTNILPRGDCLYSGASAAAGYALLAVLLGVINGPFVLKLMRHT